MERRSVRMQLRTRISSSSRSSSSSSSLLILAMCCLLPLPLTHGVSSFELRAPVNYTVFEGAISVSYSIPSNYSIQSGVVQLVALEDESVVTTSMMPPRYANGELTFMCGVVDHAGDYAFQMLERSGGQLLVQSKTMVVRWPRVDISLPATHQALMGQVTLHINVNGAACDSVDPDTSFWLDMVYFGVSSGSEHDLEAKNTVYRHEITELSSLRSVPIILQCQVIDQAGLYRVFLKSSHDKDERIASSNAMRVGWSEEYRITAEQESIFPCSKYFTVHHSQPACGGTNDKIRLYKQLQQTNSSLATPVELKYIMEQRAKKGQDAVSFNCGLFHESNVGYCFKYISMAQSGAVAEQHMHCLPTRDAMVVDGRWGLWSEWGECMVTCGSGKQNRYRACDDPPPSSGGKFCQGDTMQYRPCEIPCPPSTSVSPVSLFTPDPSCSCGCESLMPGGKIVSSLRCRGSTLWIIRAKPGHHIRLWFDLFNLNQANRHTWLKVRDGDSHLSDLLIKTYGGPRPKQAVTSGAAMLIEFMTPHDRQGDGYSREVERFVAIYTTFASNGTGLLGAGHKSSNQEIWESTVTIVGIVLCGLIILATIAFVCHHRVSNKRKRAKLPHAQEALLTKAEATISPTHSGQSAQGSANVSFADPLASPSKRDYVLAKGVTAHPRTPSSMSEHSAATIRGKKPLSPHVGGRELAYRVESPASRRSSQSSASHKKGGTPISLPSPYAIAPDGTHYHHDPSLFRVSPLPEEPSRSGRHHGNKDTHSHRHRRRSPTSPQHRRSSPGSMSPGSTTSQSRADSYNQNYRDLVASRKSLTRGPPLADVEDLSPTADPSPVHKPYLSSARRPPGDSIPMDSYKGPVTGRREPRGIGETRLTDVPSNRPPVEGRDSLGRKKQPTAQQQATTTTGQRVALPPTTGTVGAGPTTPDRQNANFLPAQIPSGDRPLIKPLPLRGVQRPDGQSPENQPGEADHNANAHTPTSQVSSEISPILHKTPLFPDNASSQTPSEFAPMENEFEYDDYVPNLPGSYFTMDPTAYQLTWSQQTPWNAAKMSASSRAPSQGSMASMGDKNNTHGHC